MNLQRIVAIAFGAACMATPLIAGAAQEGGTICGRVLAPPQYILQLSQMSAPGNVVIARSESEVVQTTVHVDGSYCFNGLHADLHTLSAFADSSGYERVVTPKPGTTLLVDLTQVGSGL